MEKKPRPSVSRGFFFICKIYKVGEILLLWLHQNMDE